MNRLRSSFDELVAEVPEYGDIDRAIWEAKRAQQRRVRLLRLSAVAAVLLVIVGTVVTRLGTEEAARVIGPATASSGPTVRSVIPPLVDGPVAPGPYRYLLVNPCEDPPYDCPPDTSPPSPLGIDVTVPQGWQAATDFHLLTPTAVGTSGPDGAALVLGWTNFWVGLHSDPCLLAGSGMPDVKVGPSVEDFVDAVQARKGLDVTKPSDVEVGGYTGRFFTLRAPSDISDCDHWRPWDPGFYAQGPDNIWDVWVIDVDGFRILIVADYFPKTPAIVRSQLRSMVESIRFQP